MEDFVRIYDGALDPAVCSSIIDRFESDTDNHYAGNVDGEEGLVVKLDYKQTTELALGLFPEWSDIDALLYEKISGYFKLYLDSLGNLFGCKSSTILDEPYRVKRYDIGGGYQWHIDTAPSPNITGRRWIAAIWYLNTVYQGGETEFRNSGRAVRPVTGRLLFFPCTWTFMHRSVPCYSGPKYIVSTFFFPSWLHLEKNK